MKGSSFHAYHTHKSGMTTKGAYVLGDKSLSNVNPGDCYVLQWKITNEGSKKIQLRTELDFGWTNSELSKDNVYIIPVPVNDNFPYDRVKNLPSAELLKLSRLQMVRLLLYGEIPGTL